MTRKDIVAVFAIIVLVVAFLSPMLLNRLGIFFDDYYETFSRLLFNARSVRQGALPLWDSHTFAGGRINWIPNTRVWYLPFYPFYFIAPLHDIDGAYTWLIKFPLLIHWLICALAAYGLGRGAIGLHPGGAAALSVVYAFGAAMSYNICDPGTIWATVWMPLALWGISAAARGRRRMILPAVLAVSFIGPCGSDVRGLFALLTVALGVGLLAFLTALFESPRSAGRLLFFGAAVFLLGLLVSAPYWAGMKDTIALYRGSPLLETSRSASEMFSMPWRHLLTLLVPDLFGTVTGAGRIDLRIPDLAEYSHIEGNLTGGFLLMLVIAAGSVAGWRRNGGGDSRTRMWWLLGAGLYLGSLLLVTGRYSPAYRLLVRAVPVVGLPYAVRWRIMQHLGAALLAGVSAHWLWNSPRALSRFAAAAAAGLMVAGAAWQWLSPPHPGAGTLIGYIWRGYRAWFLSGPFAYVVFALVVSAGVIFFPRRPWIKTLLFLFAGAEVVCLAFLVVYFISYGDVPEWVKYARPSESAYYRWTGDPALFEPTPPTGRERTTFYFSLLDQTATLHGGDYLMGHCSKPLVPRLREALEAVTSGYPYALRITDPGSSLFPNMSVRRLVLNAPHRLPDLDGPPREIPGGLFLHRLGNALPRVFVQDLTVECSPEEQRTWLLRGDLRRAALVEREEAARLREIGVRVISREDFQSADLPGSERQTADHFKELQKRNPVRSVDQPAPGRMIVDVSMEAPGLLVTTDVHSPGWTVQVDGEPEFPLRVNYLQRGVWLEKGRHRVEWAFRPRAVRWGLIGTIAGLLGSIILAVAGRRESLE